MEKTTLITTVAGLLPTIGAVLLDPDFLRHINEDPIKAVMLFAIAILGYFAKGV